MIDDLNRRLAALLGRDDVRLERIASWAEARAREGEHVYPCVPPDLAVCARERVDYRTLHAIREMAEQVLSLARDNEALASQNDVLSREVSQLLDLEDDFLVDDVYLRELFQFSGPDTAFCILRDRAPLAHFDLAEQTVDYCLKGLRTQGEFTVPVEEGEIYAVSVDDYQGIFEAPEPIPEFSRRLIKLKLSWLATKHREKLVMHRLRYMEEMFQQSAASALGPDDTAQDQPDLGEDTEYRKLDAEFRSLLRKAITDSLTNIYNRQKIRDLLQKALDRSRSDGAPLCVILFDIDGFKQVNDEHGHLVGDRILISVTERTQALLGERDVLARWGGEEFLAMLPDTDAEGGRRLAERLRARVAARRFEHGLAITCSYGVAELAPGDSLDDLLGRVDRALYDAKGSGRNRVIAMDGSAGVRSGS